MKKKTAKGSHIVEHKNLVKFLQKFHYENPQAKRISNIDIANNFNWDAQYCWQIVSQFKEDIKASVIFGKSYWRLSDELQLEYVIAQTKQEKPKSGMYGETPKITIGKYSISMMSDKPGETKIWIQCEDGGEFESILLEPYIDQFYNKHF